MQNGQTEQNQDLRLDFGTRRRTKVRRVAKFVRSIKHIYYIKFLIYMYLKGILQASYTLQNSFSYILFYTVCAFLTFPLNLYLFKWCNLCHKLLCAYCVKGYFKKHIVAHF